MAKAKLSNLARTDEELRLGLRQPGEVVAEVETDPRVFEWITTGLYREPASAIRELISNAYDADAEKVTITTGAPYFQTIVVEDDGRGMSVEALTRLMHHVGGSLKRDQRGNIAGITGVQPGFSVKGRRLIGSKGIGLYSVSRLTSTFRITTKEEGSTLEHEAMVRLSEFEEGALKAEPFVAGRATISTRSVTGTRVNEHGTKVELLDITPDARRVLQSIERWETYDSLYDETTPSSRINMMRFHSGRVSELEPDMLIAPARLPWEESDQPLERFRKFVDCLSERDQTRSAAPAIDVVLDYYLSSLWKISLSAPLQYIEKSPSELTNRDGIDFYDLKGDATPEPVKLKPGETLGEHFGLVDQASATPFRVTVDGVELRRPVVFRGFQKNKKRLLARPKMFVGTIDSETTKGERLYCSMYFYWNYALVPRESNGILVRINGSSGTLFDHQFLDFRTAELARLKQISSEVFVYEGLDDALNVDRESFDDTDLRYLELQRNVHRAMTRIMSRVKSDQRKAAGERRNDAQEAAAERVREVAGEIWKELRKGRSAPKVVVTSKTQAPPATSRGIYVTGVPSSHKRGSIDRDPVFNSKLGAIILILDGYHLLDDLDSRTRAELIGDIAKILDLKQEDED